MSLTWLKQTVIRAERCVRYRRITRCPGMLWELSRYANLKPGVVEIRDGGAWLPGSDMDLLHHAGGRFLHVAHLLAGLQALQGTRIGKVGEGSVSVEVLGVRLLANSPEDVLIIHEVFVGGIYNACLLEPFHVVDIGMNKAVTSLFFANDPKCVGADGFELFPPTADEARRNIAANPSIAAKVRVHAYGLAKAASVAELDYCPEYSGSLGIMGLRESLAKTARGTMSRVRVEFRPCVQELRPILEAIQASVVMKIDCEGAEYEILPEMAAAGLLARIDVILMEWHVKGPGTIIQMLRDAGFCCLALEPYATSHSMIYAWRPGARHGVRVTSALPTGEDSSRISE